MRVIAKRTLRAFWSIPGHEDAKEPLEAWHREALQADWSDPHAVKAQFRSASILKGNRVVFNIAGNKYRLVVKINYPYRVVYVRFIGTHAEYDAIDVEAV
ncbi:type II toxin-antitoxin system HigB family toxin [Fodinibius sp.]|uniref:type II toxin-antitoxin system HigB family toxin n=1 Tax=Fodinibius sp. TaxID=1872440 RepID=UPI002ACE96A2|nr:type II toxin-antitoxin system HigB family toxin [Fodinibius sp.]